MAEITVFPARGREGRFAAECGSTIRQGSILMSGKAEEMVQLLQSNPSMWALGGDMPIFRDGLADMLTRIQALEGVVKAMNTPATPPPPQPE